MHRFLTVDIPTAPLFRDEHERNIIPQIPLYKLLSKFDGETVSVRGFNNHHCLPGFCDSFVFLSVSLMYRSYLSGWELWKRNCIV